MHQELSGPDRAGLGEALHEGRQGVVGDGQEHQIRQLQHLRGRYERHIGQHPRGAAHGGVRDSGDGDGPVPGLLERTRQRGTDAAGSDDADGEPGRAWLL
ncbi:hypothetical protein GCM10010425_67030 [Streptomyces spororaveus]|uniref:Uncharacterized protein n=1 Tax=Streptomyces spororaveus TaxID=284039 RepID=A0ABQ3TDV7_9ACTN|nr:hypothetical protein Sspor_41690 [Streptomyces spororaveus]